MFYKIWSRIFLVLSFFGLSSCKKGCEFTRPIFTDSPNKKHTIVDVMQICGQGAMATSANPKLYLVEKDQIGVEFLPSKLTEYDLIYGATSSADVDHVAWVDDNNLTIYANTHKTPAFISSHKGINIRWKSRQESPATSR
jgi:hypothetical protein